MSARARRLSVLLAVLLAIATPLAVAVAAASGPDGPTYRVKSGDTITSIAVQLRLPGGWEQLYKANQDRIGGDPNRLTVGTDLAVPQGVAVPAGQGYVVQPGDTLDSIAGRLNVAGGGAALYAANRNAIGPDPNRLDVGQTLLPPGATAPGATAPGTSPAQTSAAGVPPAALNRPAAPAPVEAAATSHGSAAPAAGSGGGNAVLWTVLAVLLFALFVLLVLVTLPRWRRSSAKEVWVGGTYSADNQPDRPIKHRLAEASSAVRSSRTRADAAGAPTAASEHRGTRSEPAPLTASAAPVEAESESAHVDLTERDPAYLDLTQPASAQLDLTQPAPARRSEPDEPQPVRLVGPQRFQEPRPVQLTNPEPFFEPQPFRLIDTPGTGKPQPAPRSQAQHPDQSLPRPVARSDAQPGPRSESVPPRERTRELSGGLASPVAGLRSGGMLRRGPRQRARSLLHAAVGGLRDERRPQPGATQRDLTDELLGGEVRLVDPSTPLTKDRRQAS